jgi:shikimate kinase
METQLLKKLEKSEERFVLSIGGGMPVKEENRELLRQIGTVVYLKATKEELVRRLSGDISRPLLQGGALEEKVAALMAARESIYVETAHQEVVTDGKSVKELIEKIS